MWHCVGLPAVRYFERVCPEEDSIVTPNGHFLSNEAEWIVDLTTKVRSTIPVASGYTL